VNLNDLVGPDALFVYGEDVREAYEHYMSDYPEYPCRVFSVGSSRLDRLKDMAIWWQKGKSTVIPKGINILYIITNYYCNSWYCGFSPPISDNLYYRDQCIIIGRLCNLIERRKDLRVTIKLYPNLLYDYDPPWIDDVQNIGNINIVRNEKSAGELLGSHNISVIDFPSTTLLEALSVGRPVFVLSRIVMWPDRVTRKLEKAAWVAEDPEDLMDQMERLIESGFLESRSNSAFLKKYGIHIDDGKSFGRAFDILKQQLDDTK